MVLVHAGYVVAETAVLCYLAVLLERDALQSAELKSAIAAIRQHDKTINLSPKSEAVSSSGKALEDVLELISKAVGQVQATAFTTTDAANQIATNSAELENRTRQQSSSISTVVNEMNSLRETIQVNVEHAGKADHLATDASSVARRGGTQVTKLVERMGSIDSSSRRIAEIITVIDGIAFQTNILALNAAVEAARAGEQGRGFAVVASEVRSLAQRSAVAAKEIKALIEGSVSEVKLGTELANETGQTMSEIVHSVNAVTHIINEIATGSAEQEKRANRVGMAAQALEENTAQNASMVEAAAQAADLLREQATTLKQVVGVFTLQPSSKTKAVHRTALLR